MRMWLSSLLKKTYKIFLTITNIASLVIATIYDFYKIPGEKTNLVFNFFFLALVTWSASFVAIYFAHVALHDVREIESGNA
jgi:hypothetical protein